MMSLEEDLCLIKVPVSQASNTYENWSFDHIRIVVLVLSIMAPNLASSQHDLIQDMILDKKLKTHKMADIAECNVRSINRTFTITGLRNMFATYSTCMARW